MLKKIDKNVLILAAGLVLGLSLGYLILSGMQIGVPGGEAGVASNQATNTGPRTGSLSPDFELEGLDGKSVQLSSLAGLPVLLNFWASWCDPCKAEMPLLEKTYQAHPSDLVILAVNDDEPEEVVREYILENRLTFKILLDPGEKTKNAYRVTGLPTSFFIDRDGIIRYIQVGVLNDQVLGDHLGQIGVGK